MRITAQKEKLDLIDKLIKDGAISLAEGLLLLEVETITEYIKVTDYTQPQIPYTPLWPGTAPYNPNLPYTYTTSSNTN